MDEEVETTVEPAPAVEETPALRAKRLTDAEPHRTVQGSPAWQAAGLVVLVLGLAIYLHGLWATANAVLDGAALPQRNVDFGPFEVVQGTVGLMLAVLGLAVTALAMALPVRIRPDLAPGTLEYGVAVETGLWERRMGRRAAWTALGLIVAGGLVAGYALKRTVTAGELYVWSFGGGTLRPHLLGSALAALGFTLLLAVGFRAVGRDELVAVVEAHTRDDDENGGRSGRER